MNQTRLDRLFFLSMFIIGIISTLLGVCNLLDAAVPDLVRYLLGILDLICLPVLIFTSVKKFVLHTKK